MEDQCSLDTIRKELKSWENTFKEINGRKMTKSDLDVAPAKIRDLYRKYERLRNGDVENEKTETKSKCRLKRAGFDFNKPIHHLSKLSTRPKVEARRRQSHHGTTDIPETSDVLDVVNPTFIEIDRSTKGDQFLIGQRQFVSYFRATSIEEMDSTRKNLRSLAMINIEDENGSNEESEGFECSGMSEEEGSADFDNEQDQEDTDFTTGILPKESDQSEYQSRKKASKKKRSNENFVRLDMKRKRYQGKALKKLKGAALKRFLFRQRIKKQRKL